MSSPPAGTKRPDRAANYITDCAGRAGDHSARRPFGVHPEQRDAFARSARRPGVGCLRQRQDRAARRLRHLLLADRRSQLSAEFAASVQRVGYRSPTSRCLRSCRLFRSAAGRPRAARAFRRPAPLTRRRACKPTRRRRRSRSGISPWSSSSTAIRSLRVAYVGSFGYHGLLSVDPNTIPAQICANAAAARRAVPAPRKSTVPQGAQYIPVGRRGPIRTSARASSGTPRATAATTRCRST